MANPIFNISLDYPQVTSATKRIEKSQSNILLKIVQEVTVKGKLLELNNQTGYSAIWSQINTIEDNKEAKNCTLNFAGLMSFSGVKIIDISFDQTSNQDVKSKDFSISFEVYESINTSLLTTQYGMKSLDLKDISDIKISQAKEENLEGKTLTTSISITFGENANSYSLGRAETIAKAILATLNILSVNSSRTTASNVYDETSGTYSFIETKNEYRGSSGGFSVLRSTNYNIQNNGSIVVTENGQIKIEKNNDFKIKDLYDKAITEAQGSKSRCQVFIGLYYQLTYGNLPSEYRNTFEETTRQVTVDEAAGTAQYSVSVTNESEYMSDVRVEIISTLEDLKKEKAKRKIIRGTITGIKNPPSKEITLSKNKKLQAAKNYFDANYQMEFTNAKELNTVSKPIGQNSTYITNGDITYNISEGSINFSLTYEDRPEYSVENQKLIYGSAEKTSQYAVHLANQFLTVGGDQPGEEVIQETNQSKPIEINLRLESLLKESDDVIPYIVSFKELIKKEYKEGIITAINISMNVIARTFQGTATWFNFGDYRERFNTDIKVQNPSEIKI